MAADEKPRWVRIGRVARPHGIRGELLIRADDPDSTSLLDQDELFLRDEKGAVEKRRIASARVHRGDYRIVLEGLDDRDAAEALKGREVLLDRGALPDIEADEFYVADLVGLEVVGPEGGLGRVARVLDTGGVPILEVR
ncbi:MAG: ribosome maturation factor RimM, partial [Myxococcales bacterium]